MTASGDQTLGQYRVGSTFNPSGSGEAGRLKEKAAAFIDECKAQLDGVPDLPEFVTRDAERRELYQRAMREAEAAAMWAVKAAAKRMPE